MQKKIVFRHLWLTLFLIKTHFPICILSASRNSIFKKLSWFLAMLFHKRHAFFPEMRFPTAIPCLYFEKELVYFSICLVQQFPHEWSNCKRSFMCEEYHPSKNVRIHYTNHLKWNPRKYQFFGHVRYDNIHAPHSPESVYIQFLMPPASEKNLGPCILAK